jgi:pyruvate dehydrogenase E2 component (dihydrolipoamide acetyltransferase)
MPEEIVMPRLSDTMVEGTVARWLKREGEAVHKGEPLLEVETDKATMELPAFGDGVLSKILVAEGTKVPLGSPIGLLAGPGEAPAGDQGGAGEARGGTAPEGNGAEAQHAPRAGPAEAAPAAAARADSGAAAAPPDETAPAEGDTVRAAPGPPDGGAGVGAANSEASGAAPATSPGIDASGAAPAANVPAVGEPLRATPVARRLAEEHDLDLTALRDRGSGPSGRIVQADVERYLEERGRSGAGPAVPAGGPAAADADGDVEVRLVGQVHRVMAERTLQSVRDIPQYALTAEIDMGNALDLRRQLEATFGDAGKVTINDLVLRAVALALLEVPEVNSRWQDGELAVYRRVHLGVAVAVPDGLVVPVIRDAEQKPLRQIGAEARGLAEKARQGKLGPAEMQGSTFTVTNLGMFDVEEFRGIINPPEAGLLAVGTIVERPVAWEGQVVLRPRMRVTLSADHRAYSGDVGARFLQAVKRLLQEPLRLGF